MWIDESVTESSVRTAGVELNLCDLGVVVLDADGRVASFNDRACELLLADSEPALDDRLSNLRRLIGEAQYIEGSTDEAAVDVPGVGALGVRSCAVAGPDTHGTVLLLRDVRALSGTADLLQQAARHRAFTFFSRDWAHDLKGMLHVIRINGALLGRLLQRMSPVIDPAMTRCLEAISREVERLDRSIELAFGGRHAEKPSTFDLGAMCQRLKEMIAARAIRQRVDVVLELTGGSKEIVGFEDVVQGALLNVLVNALEAMPEEGRLEIIADGHGAGVTVRVADSGSGMQPQPDDGRGRVRFSNTRGRTGIGLHVTYAVVEAHGGRIDYPSNVPHGTTVDITFPPAASTGRLRDGSRTHR